ncbi:hypothetical protein ACFQ10_46610 [Streptomyces indonesiensis]
MSAGAPGGGSLDPVPEPTGGIEADVRRLAEYIGGTERRLAALPPVPDRAPTTGTAPSRSTCAPAGPAGPSSPGTPRPSTGCSPTG